MRSFEEIQAIGDSLTLEEYALLVRIIRHDIVVWDLDREELSEFDSCETTINGKAVLIQLARYPDRCRSCKAELLSQDPEFICTGCLDNAEEYAKEEGMTVEQWTAHYEALENPDHGPYG